MPPCPALTRSGSSCSWQLLQYGRALTSTTQVQQVYCHSKRTTSPGPVAARIQQLRNQPAPLNSDAGAPSRPPMSPAHTCGCTQRKLSIDSVPPAKRTKAEVSTQLETEPEKPLQKDSGNPLSGAKRSQEGKYATQFIHGVVLSLTPCICMTHNTCVLTNISLLKYRYQLNKFRPPFHVRWSGNEIGPVALADVDMYCSTCEITITMKMKTTI